MTHDHRKPKLAQPVDISREVCSIIAELGGFDHQAANEYEP